MLLTNKLQNMVCQCAHHRSQIANDFNGKQKLACLIVSGDRSCVLRARYKLLQC